MADDYLDDWKRFLQARYSATTVKAYLHEAHKIERRYGSLLTMESDTIDEYITDESYRLSAAAISRTLSALRAFYRWAIKNGLVETSPVDGVEAPKIPDRLPKVLTEEEVETLIMAEHPLRIRTILYLMLYAGLRLSEITRLTRGSVDLDAEQIRVIGKGDKERVVPLHAILLAQLQKWLDKTRGRRDDPLFRGYMETSLGRRAIQDLVYEAGERAGLERRLAPHMLRHTFATRLLRAGANIRVVQEILGHRSVATTQIYTHVTAEDLKRAILKL